MFNERLNPITTVAVVQTTKPRIAIHKQALAKMNTYVQKCTDEIGWLGTAVKRNNIYIIKDVLLFDQEVSGVTTEITPDGLGIFGEELLSQPNGMEIWNEIKVWGHSHVNMGVTPSAQDNTQMETFAHNGHEWFIRIIANKTKELKVDLYDFTNGICFVDCPWEIIVTAEEYEIQKQIEILETKLAEFDAKIIAETDAIVKPEMDLKVKKKFYTPTYPTTTGYGQNAANTYNNGTRYGSVKNFDGKKTKKEKKSIADSEINISKFKLAEILSENELIEVGEICTKLADVEVWLVDNAFIVEDDLHKMHQSELGEILRKGKQAYFAYIGKRHNVKFKD